VLAALGTGLVHAVRGRDEEGAAILHEALALAESAGDRALAAKVCRELGFVEVQAGRAATAGSWLGRAHGLTEGDAERAGVLAVRGMALSDRAHYAPAIALLEESVALARQAGDRRQAAWSLAILGRALLLRGAVAEAVTVLDEALALVGDERWLAFQPFPEALRAEAALALGDPGRATALLEHAFSLGCRLGDPCWEAMAARARGLVLDHAGDRPAALACLRDAVARSTRVADPYVWIQAYALDALARVEIAGGDAAAARGHVAELEAIAARCDLRELVVRAALHRAALGERSGGAAAAVLAEGIENPALHAAIAGAR
jgi:tetratricopeptide (TPR) repeat protein